MGVEETAESPRPSDVRLKLLYSQQHNFLERLEIHQRNLQKLTLQEAKHGVDVPLPLMNEIELQQTRIAEIEKELALVDNQINEITRQVAYTASDQSKPQTIINIDGVDYNVDCPFPVLGTESTTLPDGVIRTEQRYVGGFKLHIFLHKGKGLEFNFYRHGRRVSPVMDKDQCKLRFPLGAPMAVSAVAGNILRKEDFADITPERIASGRWTIISPNEPQPSQISIDWPQGYKDYIMTTRMPFDGGYELWMVQTMHDHPMKLPIMLWFYIKDWNVVPVIDKGRLALMFPSQEQE